MTTKHIHGVRIDEIILTLNEHGSFFHHHDVLGNVTHLTDSRGKVVESYTYSDFGIPTIMGSDGNELAESSVGNRFLFTGRSYWVEFGLYDYRNRGYSVELGRFIQTDPIRFEAGDVNIYWYCSNRSLTAVDPFGLDLYVVFSDAFGVNGVNHSFIWSTDTNSGIGRSGKSGVSWGDGVPDGYVFDSSNANRITDANGYSDAYVINNVRNNSTLNDGIWIPYVNDCHTVVDDALNDLGIDSPEAPNGRFDIDNTVLNALNSFMGSVFSFFSGFFE